MLLINGFGRIVIVFSVDKTAILISGKNIYLIVFGTYRKVAIVTQREFAANGTLFGGNKDNPTSCSIAINGCGRSIFEDAHSGNIVGVDDVEWISAPGDPSIVERDAVYHNQRIVSGRKRRFSPNPDF